MTNSNGESRRHSAAAEPLALELVPDHGPASGPPSYFDWVAAKGRQAPREPAVAYAATVTGSDGSVSVTRSIVPDLERYLDALDARVTLAGYAWSRLPGSVTPPAKCWHRRRVAIVDQIGTVTESCRECPAVLVQRAGPPVGPTVQVEITAAQLPPVSPANAPELHHADKGLEP